MNPFDLAFAILPIVYGVIFLVVFLVCIVIGIRIAREWKKANRLPRLTVDAKVLAKRTNVKHYRRNRGPNHHYTNYTDYYVTFQVSGGDRMELQVQDWQYGLLLEGDEGKLTFQGIRYLDFQRNP